VVEGVAWPEQTLTQLEGEDWGEPTFQSYVVTNSHRLRKKPLKDFTVEDLRFMVGQQISLPILMPMALDVLELESPFAGGDMYPGALLESVLKVDAQFWQRHQRLWYRLDVVLTCMDSFRELMDQALLPAIERFKSAGPGSEHTV
jgi:contact-dependent growth inhibition (CDI) system CdiI-like immunity protein